MPGDGAVIWLLRLWVHMPGDDDMVQRTVEQYSIQDGVVI
jgi:hypothetical protein